MGGVLALYAKANLLACYPGAYSVYASGQWRECEKNESASQDQAERGSTKLRRGAIGAWS